jgi:hypothetical protein
MTKVKMIFAFGGLANAPKYRTSARWPTGVRRCNSGKLSLEMFFTLYVCSGFIDVIPTCRPARQTWHLTFQMFSCPHAYKNGHRFDSYSHHMIPERLYTAFGTEQ